MKNPLEWQKYKFFFNLSLPHMSTASPGHLVKLLGTLAGLNPMVFVHSGSSSACFAYLPLRGSYLFGLRIVFLPKSSLTHISLYKHLCSSYPLNYNPVPVCSTSQNTLEGRTLLLPISQSQATLSHIKHGYLRICMNTGTGTKTKMRSRAAVPFKAGCNE